MQEIHYNINHNKDDDVYIYMYICLTSLGNRNNLIDQNRTVKTNANESQIAMVFVGMNPAV